VDPVRPARVDAQGREQATRSPRISRGGGWRLWRPRSTSKQKGRWGGKEEKKGWKRERAGGKGVCFFFFFFFVCVFLIWSGSHRGPLAEGGTRCFGTGVRDNPQVLHRRQGSSGRRRSRAAKASQWAGKRQRRRQKRAALDDHVREDRDSGRPARVSGTAAVHLGGPGTFGSRP